MDFNKTLHLSPYVTGAITALSYLTAIHLLPKKILSMKRQVIAIGISIVLSLLIQFILDCLFGE